MISLKPSRLGQMKLFLKIGFILFLILLLMIPNAMIRNLVNERQGLEYQTQHEIAASWGPSQKMMGPVLSIPFTRSITKNDGVTTSDYTLRVLPKVLDLDVNLTTEERKKSIYKAILYTANHILSGSFDVPDDSEFGKNVAAIHWNAATIDIGFTSSASLAHLVEFEWGGTKYKMKSGASDGQVFQSGIHADVQIDPKQKSYSFKSEIGIHGSEAMQYLPLASNTSIRMTSDWSSPGFVGLPLPTSRDITDTGFTANWSLTEYNRSFKETWENNEIMLDHRTESFGVDLVQMIGHYQKNMRSAKYALLIISLSFLVFFFFEMLKGSRIHPIQYIFVGLALSVFYTLLLSLSEHLGFGIAYLIAAVAVVGLVSWYSRFILSQGANVMILTLVLAGLYSYIYILLQMEEFALLVGSIGLFLVLAIAMYLSRHMDWYGLGASGNEEE